MGENSKIQWCDNSFNPWRGCTKVSPGCKNCYAETLSKRNPAVLGEWGPGKPRVLASESMWHLPFKWNRAAVGADRPPRVFCASLADWLDPEVPIKWLIRLLDTIRQTPNLDWLLLTKRPELFEERLSQAVNSIYFRGLVDLKTAFLQAFIDNMRRGWAGVTYSAPEVGRENYWIGTSVENQEWARRRIPDLLKIPASTRFLSCEPLIGDLGLPWLFTDEPIIHWVIVGGESGHGARECNIDWIREIIAQCQAAEVPCFVKQLGAKCFQPPKHNGGTGYFLHYKDRKGGDDSEWPADLRVKQWPKTNNQQHKEHV